MSNACSGLTDTKLWRIVYRHDLCTGAWVKLVPGSLDYVTGLCVCLCGHGGT